MNCGCTSNSAGEHTIEGTRARMTTDTTTRQESAEGSEQNAAFLAPVDMYETDADYVIVADIPGARSEDVDVRTADGVLHLSARIAQRQADARQVISEYRVGDYRRQFRFTSSVNTQNISAELSAGVLTIRVPKSVDSRPRKIEVRSA